MKLHIKSTGFELTPPISEFIEKKFNSLEKFLGRWEKNGEVLIKLEVAKNTKHHNKGMIFYAEANVELPKNVLRVEETDDDMMVAIDKLKDRVKKEILKLKDKLADH